MNKKSGLGRGLGALFGGGAIPPKIKKPKAEEKEKAETGGLMEIAVKDIAANPYQPRQTFDKEKLQELADSIKEFGVVQPLVVRKKGKSYEVAAGERRLRAAKMAGIKKVPVVLSDYDDTKMMEIALVENIQRHDLNPIEEAQGLRQLMGKCKLTQEQAAAKVGRSRAAVANILRLLNLPQEIQDYISKGALTMGQVKQLLALPRAEQQCSLAKDIIENDWSARTTEELVRRLKAGEKVEAVRETVKSLSAGRKKDKDKKKKYVSAEDEVFCSDFTNRLVELLGTRVRILPGQKNKKGQQGGIIEIEYYSEEDLERIYDILREKEKQPAVASKKLRRLYV